jgi:hypothetical protein
MAQSLWRCSRAVSRAACLAAASCVFTNSCACQLANCLNCMCMPEASSRQPAYTHVCSTAPHERQDAAHYPSAYFFTCFTERCLPPALPFPPASVTLATMTSASRVTRRPGRSAARTPTWPTSRTRTATKSSSEQQQQQQQQQQGPCNRTSLQQQTDGLTYSLYRCTLAAFNAAGAR